MIINKKSYILSPRRAADVLDLAAACEKQDAVNDQTNTIIIAQLISDSLKATGLKINIFKRLKYRRFIKGDAKFILASLNLKELFDAWNEVLELEGGKKKVVPAKESQSVEMSQKD